MRRGTARRGAPGLGLLTEREYEVLRLRATGLTQREVAERLGISRTAVASAETRARRALRIAEETLRAYRSVLMAFSMEFEAGTHVAEIPAAVFREADKAGIKVRANAEYIFGLIRFKAQAGYPRLRKGLRVLVYRDGVIDAEAVEQR
ncbi:MAG: Tfx family DNA-binding protein [Desulfurococcaceae archaeon]